MQKFCYKPLLQWCLNQNKWFNILEFILFNAILEYCQPNMLYSEETGIGQLQCTVFWPRDITVTSSITIINWHDKPVTCARCVRTFLVWLPNTVWGVQGLGVRRREIILLTFMYERQSASNVSTRIVITKRKSYKSDRLIFVKLL